MTIIKVSADLSPDDIYELTTSPEAAKLRDAAGSVLEINAWCIYTDDESVDEETGEVNSPELLSLLTPDGVYTTNSPTVVRSFRRALDVYSQFGRSIDRLKIFEGVSSKGRSYLDCSVPRSHA